MSVLSHTFVTAPDTQPSQWVLFLHGIMGSGANWRTFARRLVQDVPSLGAVLVDLRNHGNSRDLEPPHTLSQCALDLRALASHVRAQRGGDVTAVLGHSYGGKVALAYLRDDASTHLQHVWVLDSMPGARIDTRGVEQTALAFATLRALQDQVYSSRPAFIDALRERGLTAGVAEWLAMNLKRTEKQHYVFGLNLDAIEEMLHDYVARDLWPVLQAVPNNTRVHVLVGGNSEAFSASDLERLTSLSSQPNARVDHVVIANAGHWLHVDAPDATYAAVRKALDT